MADNMDAFSDTSIGSRRRISPFQQEEEEEPLLQLQRQPQQPQQEEGTPFSNSLSSFPIQDGSKAPTLLVSSPKRDQEALPQPNSFKKPKCWDTGSQEGEDFPCDLVSGSSEFGEKVENLGVAAPENWNSEVGFVSNVEGSRELPLLDAKKRQLLAELEGGSLLKNKNCKETEILGSLKGIGESVRSSLKVEVIDDTALVVPVPKSGNGAPKISGKGGKRNEKQEGDRKKVKASRRRRKDEKKGAETDQWQKKSAQIGETQKELVQVSEAGNGGLKKGDRVKIKYSREEMENLSFVNIVEQRKLWRNIYTGLEDSVVKGYDDLASSKHQKKNVQCSFDPRQRFGRTADAAGILGEVSSENVDCEFSVEEGDVVNVNELDPGCSQSIGGKDAYMGSGECSEEEDSDDDYASIQRPAFLVEGEPDFDSGPPEDGLEYLRRVRWEAAHIPKVTVAKLDRSKVNKEQSVYMPQIPEISKCPEHLLPLKQWEDAFLNDFSKLQLILSHDDGTSNEVSQKLKPMATIHEKSTSTPCFVETIILEKFNNLRTDEVHTHNTSTGSSLVTTSDMQSMVNAEDNSGLTFSVNRTPKGSTECKTRGLPTFSAIMAMDSVARISMLRKRIDLVESMNTLSRDDCVWLFALCAAVDTPLDADTCASLRSLLRKCASLRAEKSELDDEVVMLNILATIAGRYFGQSER